LNLSKGAETRSVLILIEFFN